MPPPVTEEKESSLVNVISQETKKSHDNDNAFSASDTTETTTSLKWFPLESNPDLLNDYLLRLGLDTSKVALVDVFSTEDWALAMIPRPVHAVLMLYPLTDKSKERPSYSTTMTTIMKQQDNSSSVSSSSSSSSSLIYIPQRIGNACGSMALLHAALNACRDYFLENGWLTKFYESCQALSPIQRAKLLESDATLAQLHEQATRGRDNQTRRHDSLDAYDDLETHFVTYICDEPTGRVVELDGRRSAGGPLDCNMACTPETLLETACAYVASHIMPLDPTELRFTILALASVDNDENE